MFDVIIAVVVIVNMILWIVYLYDRNKMLNRSFRRNVVYTSKDSDFTKEELYDKYQQGLITYEQYEDYSQSRYYVKFRTDSLKNLRELNPILHDRELILVKDGCNVYMKMGNGKTCFNDLPYICIPATI
jgi:hypothetical protein